MSRKALKRIPLEKLMDLKIDYAFKQLFGSEKNKAITVVFLNAILKRTGRDNIKEITFQNIEIGGEYFDDKQSRLDILVKTQNNQQINVEIQFTNKYDMVKRSIFYWSQLYSDQLSKSMSYVELNPTITVNILNFDLFPKTDLFHTTFHLYEDEEKFRMDDMMEFHFIEIPKLLQHWKEERLDPWNDVLARFLLLLGIVDHRKGQVYEDIYKELEEITMKDEHLRDAFTSWEELSSTPDGLLAYRSRLKRIMDEEAAFREAELRAEAALERGLERGIEQGIEKGIEQGIVKGIEQEKIEIAQNLIAKGMDNEFIVDITKLSVDQIEEIRKRYSSQK